MRPRGIRYIAVAVDVGSVEHAFGFALLGMVVNGTREVSVVSVFDELIEASGLKIVCNECGFLCCSFAFCILFGGQPEKKEKGMTVGNKCILICPE